MPKGKAFLLLQLPTCSYLASDELTALSCNVADTLESFQLSKVIYQLVTGWNAPPTLPLQCRELQAGCALGCRAKPKKTRWNFQRFLLPRTGNHRALVSCQPAAIWRLPLRCCSVSFYQSESAKWNCRYLPTTQWRILTHWKVFDFRK